MIKKAPSKTETKTTKAKKAKVAETTALPPLSEEADSSVLNRLYDVVQSRKNAAPRSAILPACSHAGHTRLLRSLVKKPLNA